MSILHVVGRFPLADEFIDDDDQTEGETREEGSKSNRLKRCWLVAAFTAGAVIEVHVVVAHLSMGLQKTDKQAKLALTKLRII